MRPGAGFRCGEFHRGGEVPIGIAVVKGGSVFAADMPLPPPPAAPIGKGKGKAPYGKGKSPIVTRG